MTLTKDTTKVSDLLFKLTKEAAEHVAQNLLPDDRREVVEGHGLDITELASESLSWGSGVYLVMPNGETAGMGGVTTDNRIWMLCTPAINKYPLTFARAAKRILGTRKEKYLWNYVDKRNKAHCRLLKFLGFTFLREVQMGPNNLPFIEFIKLKWQ